MPARSGSLGRPVLSFECTVHELPSKTAMTLREGPFPPSDQADPFIQTDPSGATDRPQMSLTVSGGAIAVQAPS